MRIELTKEQKQYIRDNSETIPIPEMAVTLGIPYDNIYKYIKAKALSMVYTPHRSYNPTRSHFTNTYQTKLFAAIKFLERERDFKNFDLLKNMREEYRTCLDAPKSNQVQFKYHNLGSSVMHIWKPIITHVNKTQEHELPRNI